MGVYLTARLPSTYQEVERIEGNATGCSIDTGLTVGSSNFSIECDVMATSLNVSEQPIASIRTSTYKYWNYFIRENGGSYYLETYTAGHHMTGTITANTKYHSITSRVGTSWSIQKDADTPVTWTYSPGSVNNTTVKLFRRGDGLIPSTPSTLRLYYLKLTVGGNLVGDFVPCYRKSDGVIGMYNLANDTFLVNQGTGTFSKGADVTMAELKNAYIGQYTV